MPYTPPPGGNIILNLAGAYIPPSGGNIVLGDAPVSLPLEASQVLLVAYNQAAPLQTPNSSGWSTKKFICASMSCGYAAKLAPLCSGKVISWKNTDKVVAKNRDGWHEEIEKVSNGASVGWSTKPKLQGGRMAAWRAEMAKVFPFISFGDHYYPKKNVGLVIAYDANQDTTSKNSLSGWNNPRKTGTPHRDYWGINIYKEICYRKYQSQPGGNIVLNLHIPIKDVSDGSKIILRQEQLNYDLRCSQREPTGRRDTRYYRPKPKPPSGPWLKVYTMINTAMLSRLPERSPVFVKDMTISTSWDDLYWQISATLGDDAAYDLLFPGQNGRMTIEPIINGHTWAMQVDGLSKSDVWAGRGRSIRGRSLSAQLTAPAAAAKTYTESNQRTAWQLMEQELENTGWSVNFDGLSDWLIPGGVYSYCDMTPMQAIKMLADCPLAIVYTDMAAKIITIKPRYKVNPWQLATATPDIVIPDAMCETISTETDDRQVFNAVTVSGEEGGISATITRAGTAGDMIAPMVVNKLITATEVATALGVVTIGNSGDWLKHKISLPVFVPPDLPGVIIPGMIIRYQLSPTNFWQAFVAAVSVRAERNTKGLKVRQEIDVLRYYGN